jgi:hypothetical protein
LTNPLELISTDHLAAELLARVDEGAILLQRDQRTGDDGPPVTWYYGGDRVVRSGAVEDNHNLAQFLTRGAEAVDRKDKP